MLTPSSPFPVSTYGRRRRFLATPARLTAITMLALIAYYFVGYDQGAVSVFGSDTHIHEFLHDARHLLGFPCH